jgi:hypothetical protein
MPKKLQEYKTMNQKGFAPLLIFIALAVIVGVGVVAYGFFIAKQQNPPAGKSTQISEQSTIRTIPLPPVQPSIVVGTPECPELDYTGCDTSGNFMTWKDDSKKDSDPSSKSTIILK